jgi:hypothetical protein
LVCYIYFFLPFSRAGDRSRDDKKGDANGPMTNRLCLENSTVLISACRLENTKAICRKKKFVRLPNYKLVRKYVARGGCQHGFSSVTLCHIIHILSLFYDYIYHFGRNGMTFGFGIATVNVCMREA